MWIISAYQLTFASFLLVVRVFPTGLHHDRVDDFMKSGRISNVYSPKPVFVSGVMILALTHLGAGFVRHKIALLILRALGGIGGALTIPSARSMTVALFPDQRSQDRAIAIFGGTGGIGNGELYPCHKQPARFTFGFNSSGVDHWCSARSVYHLAVDLLLYGDYGLDYWNYMPHTHPKVRKTYLQGSFRLLRYRHTVL